MSGEMLASAGLLAASASVAVASPPSAFPTGKVFPKGPGYKQSWAMSDSTAIMICNSSGQVSAEWAAQWSMVDIDWNSDKVDWSKPKPMNSEENMLRNAQAIKAVNPNTVTWVYRNGIKALPWFTDVREKLEDKAYWGWFVAKKGCNPSPGVYVCGPNATANLYHDFEQTPHGDCGNGVECGEYVFDHRNSSIRQWLIDTVFLGSDTGGGNAAVQGFYVDDGWSAAGPSEMDKDAVAKMGLSPSDVTDMINAWSANRGAWRQAVYDKGLFIWWFFYGGQQTAPGWNQSSPQTSCQQFMKTNCGAASPSQNGTMFFGFSRVNHHQAWLPNGTLPYGDQDVAAFLLTRGPWAYLGYGWTGCADAAHPFTRPKWLETDFGTPQGFCEEKSSGVWAREWSMASVSLDCNRFEAKIDMKSG